MVIVQDSRERLPFSFLSAGADITVEVGKLEVGDYSLRGLQNKIAVERKSLADLVQSISRERERFFKELTRAQGLESFCIVVESSWMDLSEGKYRSNMDAGAAAASVVSIMSRMHIPVFFAGSRELAELFTASFLRQFLKGKQHELDAVRDALKVNTSPAMKA